MVSESSEPYLDAVWYNFSAERPTITEEIVTGKMVERVWDGVVGMFGKGEVNADSATETGKSSEVDETETAEDEGSDCTSDGTP